MMNMIIPAAVAKTSVMGLVLVVAAAVMMLMRMMVEIVAEVVRI